MIDILDDILEIINIPWFLLYYFFLLLIIYYIFSSIGMDSKLQISLENFIILYTLLFIPVFSIVLYCNRTEWYKKYPGTPGLYVRMYNIDFPNLAKNL